MVIYTSCNKDGGSNLDYLTFPTTVHCMGHAQNIVLSLLNIIERSSTHAAQAQHSAYLDPVSDMLRKSTEINSTENEGAKIIYIFEKQQALIPLLLKSEF